MFSLEYIQDNILAYADANIPQSVEETAIPDISQIAAGTNGKWNPFVTLQFGDIQQQGPRSMAGTRGDNYVLPVYLQVTAPEASMARRVGNKITNVFLGASFDWAGEVRKRVGGHQYPIVNSDGAVEAYIMPLSFGINVQLAEIVTP